MYPGVLRDMLAEGMPFMRWSPDGTGVYLDQTSKDIGDFSRALWAQPTRAP
jgi:hypothetical protein